VIIFLLRPLGERNRVTSTSVCLRVCVCVCVCPLASLQNYTSDLRQIFVPLNYGRDSVLSWRRCDMSCASGFYG